MNEGPTRIPSIRVLGTRVHMARMSEAVRQIDAWTNADDAPRYVVASNMHAIMEARGDDAFRQVLNDAALFLPDGISTVWIGRQRGHRLPGRVTGTDLMLALCEDGVPRARRHYLYGDTDETLAALQSNLRKRFPGIEIVGAYSPPFRELTDDEDEGVVTAIRQAQPDLLWVALGCPRQERWMREHRDRLGVPVVLGVGAAFKFIAEPRSRAPGWARAGNLEWLWRLCHEPRRIWRRVFVLGLPFLALASLESWKHRRRVQTDVPTAGSVER